MQEQEIILQKEINELNIAILEEEITKVYPELEDIEITPSGVEQNFKSEKYGYDNVKVKAVASDNLEITPSLEEQEYIGLYGKVNVEPATEVYNNAYQEGKNSVVMLEKYATTMRFENLNLFGTKEVALNFEIANEFDSLFALTWTNPNCATNNIVEHITISTKEKVRNMYRLFFNSIVSRADTTLKRVTFNFELDTESASSVNMNNCFQNAKGIEVIDGIPLNVSNVKTFNSAFTQCINLREIRFVENTIKGSIGFPQSINLSDETIESIINGLADLPGSDSRIITLHTDVKAKLTEEQIARITAKNWTLA